MQTVYDFVTCHLLPMHCGHLLHVHRRGVKGSAHFMLPAAAFAIANQVGNHAGDNLAMNVLAVILIVAGIGYTFVIVRL